MKETIKLKEAAPNFWEIFKKCDVMIAGGAITSVFCNREINDIDVYFRHNESMSKMLDFLLEECYSSFIPLAITERSLFLKDSSSGIIVNLILYRTFSTAEELFKSFDFTVCMGAYNCSTDKYVFHDQFMKHNSQRYLHFNPSTDFPIVSSLRVKKYQDRGYSIGKAQFIKILMCIRNLEINTWEDFRSQVGGMYGEQVSILDVPFDENTAIDYIDSLKLEDSPKESKVTPDHIRDVFLDNIDPSYVSVKDRYFKVLSNSFKNGIEVLEEHSYLGINNKGEFSKSTLNYNVEIVNGGEKGITATKGSKIFNHIIDNFMYSNLSIVELAPLDKVVNSDNHVIMKGEVKIKKVWTYNEWMNEYSAQRHRYSNPNSHVNFEF